MSVTVYDRLVSQEIKLLRVRRNSHSSITDITNTRYSMTENRSSCKFGQWHFSRHLNVKDNTKLFFFFCQPIGFLSTVTPTPGQRLVESFHSLHHYLTKSCSSPSNTIHPLTDGDSLTSLSPISLTIRSSSGSGLSVQELHSFRTNSEGSGLHPSSSTCN